jgi:hypothetical protein
MSARLVIPGTILAAVLGAVAPAAAVEATCDTFIATAPFTISLAGHYCLSKNLTYTSTSGAAVTIGASGVVLDLKGYRIGGAAAGLATLAQGVVVLNHGFVTVRNGSIRGFAWGVYFVAGSANNNNVAEDLTVDASTLAGIFVDFPANNNTVRNCTVTNTGGSTAPTAIQATAGISVSGTSGFVTDNTVTNTFPDAQNPIHYGITLGDGIAANNRVIGDGAAVSNYCMSLGAATALYKDNVVTGCSTAYLGGTAVGTTNYP